MFEEIVQALREPGEGTDFAALATQLDAGVKNMADGYTATLSARDAAIAQLTAEKAALQSHNYQLMMAKAESEPLDDDNSDKLPTGVAGLF